MGGADHAATAPAFGRARALLLASAAVVPLCSPANAQAPSPPPTLPTGGQVVAGAATITAPAPDRLRITQTTPRVAIDWQGFSVGQGGHVEFRQPSASAFALNRVTGPEASVIAGRITANGQVAIVNQSGVVFTPTARVDTAGLIASAAGITNENFMAGRMVFDAPPRPGATVVNEGRITVAEGGLAALVAPQAANRGTIEARLGRVVIGGAETYALDLHGDGLISLEVTRPTAVSRGPAAANTGMIAAEGGTVLITAEAAGRVVESLVEAGGTIAARNGGRVSVAARGGEARVSGAIDASATAGRGGEVAVSGREVMVAQTARIDASGAAGGGRVRLGGDIHGGGAMPRADRTTVARGASVRADATVAGAGGTVVVWADDAAFVHGALSARGGPAGGDGGFIETSGRATLSLAGISVDAGAPAGRGGTWLIDPYDLTIGGETTNGTFVDGVFTPNPGVAAATLSAGSLGAALETTNVVLTTAGPGPGTGNITVAQPVFWGSEPENPAMTTLTLDAVGSIAINAPIFNPTGSLVLNAGPAGSISQSAAGAITISRLAATAGRDITLISSSNAIAEVTALTSTGGSISLANAASLAVTGPVSAAASLSLAAPALSSSATARLSAGSGQTLTLRTNTLTLGTEAAAPNGRIVILPLASGRGMTLGGTTQPGETLNVTQATLGRLATDDGMLQLGGGAGTGPISITGATTIAGPVARTLELRSAGAVSQTQRLAVERLIVSGGSVSLDDPTNAIATLGPSGASAGAFSFATSTAPGSAFTVDSPISAAGAVTLRNSTGGIVLAQALVVPGTLTLDAAGNITQAAAATLTAGTLAASVSGAGASLLLDTAPNAIAGLGPVSVDEGGDRIAVTTLGPLTVSGPLLAPGAVSLASGNALSVAAPIAAGGPLSLTAGAGLSLGAAIGSDIGVALAAFGTISQTAAGAIAAPSLTATASGPGASIALATAPNAVERLTGATIAAGGGALSVSTTTALVIDGPVIVPGAATISAGGRLTQTARIVAAALTAGAGADGLVLDRADNAFGTLAGATASEGPVTVKAAADLVVSGPVSGRDVTLNAAGPLTTLAGATANATGTVTVTAGAGVTLAAPVAGGAGVVIAAPAGVSTADISSGGDVSISGGSVAAGGAVTAGSGRTLTITANAISAAAALRAPAGTVRLAPRSAGAAVWLGTSFGPGLTLPAATLARVDAGAGTLAIGSATAGAIVQTVPLTLTAQATTLSLQGTSVAQVAPLAVTRLAADTGSGPISMGQGGNAIARLGPVQGGAVTVATGTALVVEGPVNAATLALAAGGAVTQAPAATISTARLSGSAASLALDGTAHAIGTLGPFSTASGGLALATSGPLALAGAITTPGTLALSAGGPITAASDARLTAARLRGGAAGGTALDGAAHAIAALGPWSDATGGLSLRTNGPLPVDGTLALGGPLTLAVAGALSIGADVSAGGAFAIEASGPVTQAGGFGIATPLLSGRSTGGTGLTRPGNRIDALGPWDDAAGGLALATGGALALAGPLTLAGDLDLRAATTIVQDAAAPVRASRVSAEAPGGIVLIAPGNVVFAFGPLTAVSGDVRVVNVPRIDLAGAVTAGGTLALASGGRIRQSAPVAAGRLEASAVGGILLPDEGNAIRALGDVTATGSGPIRLATGTDLAIDGLLMAAGPIRLEIGGAVAQAGSSRLQAPLLSGRSSGGAELGSPANRVVELAGWTNTGAGGFRYAGTGGLAVTAPVDAGTEALQLDLRAGGAIAIGAGLTAGRLLSVAAADGLTLGDVTYAAPAIELRSLGAGREIRLAGGTWRAADRLIIAGGGDLTVTGTMRVEGLSPGNRPTIVFSVRSGAEATGFVRPDLPGLPDSGQPTQIEDFDAPTGQTRNRLALGASSLVAPSSALFLVIDGGSATGAIDVSRLGLIILRGATDLSGCVNGVCGPNAASLGRTTDASAEARLNNCPVSSPNCLSFANTVSVVGSRPPASPVLVAEQAVSALEFPLADVSDEEE